MIFDVCAAVISMQAELEAYKEWCAENGIYTVIEIPGKGMYLCYAMSCIDGKHYEKLAGERCCIEDESLIFCLRIIRHQVSKKLNS